MVVTVGWRFVYFMTSGIAVLAWLALCLFLPETRWERTPEELGKFPEVHQDLAVAN